MSDISKLPKWAQAEIAQIRMELCEAKALRFTDPVEPDVEPPDIQSASVRELRKGFMFNASSSAFNHDRVEPSCTSSIYHSFGTDTETRSQGTMRLYSTRLLALKAMRNAIEKDCCKRLARADAMIADAMLEAGRKQP